MDRYEYSAETRSVLERSKIPFAVYQFIDKRVVTLILSDGFLDLYGYEDRERAYYDMDHDMYKDTHPDDAARIADAAYTFATEGGRYETIYRTQNRKGDGYRIVHAVGEHFKTETGVQLAQVWYMDEGAYIPGNDNGNDEFHQMLNRALHSESMIRACYYDYLTGLPSMTYFFQLAEEGCKAIIKTGRKPSFLFMDLSGMKFYNLKHGFAKGDLLLKSFSQLLVKHFSNENCSRFGQDHFAVFTDDSGIEETLHEFFREWQSSPETKALPVRVGVYLNAKEDVDISIACDCAKLACDTLRNTFVSSISYYDSALQDDAENKNYIVSHIDEALSNRWIQVYYQPIVRAVSGKVCDEEALARWADPVRGFLSPADFIPILEEAKMIYKLDLYMVDRIIEKIKTMQDKGIHIVPQSVNLSRTDFDACDIVSEICMKMDRAGLSHDLLTIEITESMVGNNFDFMKKQIERFRNLGFQVWMDDFGSGYSSIDVLQTLKFDLIKFDMSFMQELDREGSGKIVLTELMRMATALGIETVCEGVEKEEQVRFLREIGCAKLQGFYYSRPSPLSEILEKCENGFQIGFENPKESGYFEAIGRINLYDLSIIANDGTADLKHYFSNIPMAIVEISEGKILVTRSNRSFRGLVEGTLGIPLFNKEFELSSCDEETKDAFERCLAQDPENTTPILINHELPDKTNAHTYIRKVAINPEDGTVAVVLVVLAVTEKFGNINFGDIAKSLSVDYVCLYYVDIHNGEYVEYASESGWDKMSVTRKGKDFFGASFDSARDHIYEPDRELFISSFEKESLLKILDEQGAYNASYRILKDNNPTYVHMKAMRMSGDDDHIIIGITDIDAHMKNRAKMEELSRAQSLFSIITSLAGEFVCIYTIDPKTDRYTESRGSGEFEKLGISLEGEDFFGGCQELDEGTIWKEDIAFFKESFTKEKVMRAIKENGDLCLEYHMILDGKPQKVKLKAVMAKDKDGDRLIVGVTKANTANS